MGDNYIQENTTLTQDEIEKIVREYLEKNITGNTAKTIEELRIIEKIIEQATF